MSRVTRRNPVAAASALTTPNLVGGRAVVSAEQAPGSSAVLRNYTAQSGRTRHLVTATCSDLRLVYVARVGGSGTTTPEPDLTNPIFLKVGASLDGSSWYPVTFGGMQTGQLDPGTGTLTSDPIPFDMTPGQYLYLSHLQTQAFGVATTLASGASIGATTLSLTAAPNITSGYMVVDTGGSLETVQVVSVTGSGPYTATLNPGTTVTKTHSSGAAVYQQLITDRAVYADRGEFGTNYTTLPAADRTYGGTFSAIGAVSTTLASSASPGNTTIQLAAAISSPTLVIDTAGAAETVTVVNVFGAGAPYTYYLAAPLAQSHSSGVTVASGTGYSATSFGPRMVVADRVAANSPASVVAVGDSILAGSGYQLRLNTSYLELALGATNPVVNLGVPSDTAQAFAALANSPGRRKLLAAGNWLYVQYPHNDISSSRTLPQVQADLTTIVKLGRARGMRVALNTTPPRTTSSDGWATTTNQTFDANESVRLAYNAWVRAGAGGLADLVLDVAAPLDSGTATGGASTGLWRAAGSAGPYTVDGVHPSVVGHQAMAAAINSAWLS